MAFNVPFGYLNLLFRDRVATGSFDKTAKLWDT